MRAALPLALACLALPLAGCVDPSGLHLVNGDGIAHAGRMRVWVVDARGNHTLLDAPFDLAPGASRTWDRLGLGSGTGAPASLTLRVALANGTVLEDAHPDWAAHPRGNAPQVTLGPTGIAVEWAWAD